MIFIGLSIFIKKNPFEIKCYLASKFMDILIPQITELEKINLNAIIMLINFSLKSECSIEDGIKAKDNLIKISSILYSEQGNGIRYYLSELEKNILSLITKIYIKA